MFQCAALVYINGIDRNPEHSGYVSRFFAFYDIGVKGAERDRIHIPFQNFEGFGKEMVVPLVVPLFIESQVHDRILHFRFRNVITAAVEYGKGAVSGDGTQITAERAALGIIFESSGTPEKGDHHLLYQFIALRRRKFPVEAATAYQWRIYLFELFPRNFVTGTDFFQECNIGCKVHEFAPPHAQKSCFPEYSL